MALFLHNRAQSKMHTLPHQCNLSALIIYIHAIHNLTAINKNKFAFTFFVDDFRTDPYLSGRNFFSRREQAMTYETSTAYLDDYNIRVTRLEALIEIEIHGINPKEFLEEMGDHDTYAGAAVLAWLGY